MNKRTHNPKHGRGMTFSSLSRMCSPKGQVAHLRMEPAVAMLNMTADCFPCTIFCVASSRQACHQHVVPKAEGNLPMASSHFPSFKIGTQDMTDILTHSSATE